MKTHEPIPKDFAVQPLKLGQFAKVKATCGHCGLSWDDGKSTSWTPAPSGRCPFEYFHVYPEPTGPTEYQLQKMSGERAICILESLLAELSGIEVEDLTTLEINLLQRCAVNPPPHGRGAEVAILKRQ